MSFSTFKGTQSTYTVVHQTPAFCWGVSVSLSPTQDFIIRFACLGITPKPPKHFNFRMMGEFTSEGQDVPSPGIYFDRKVIKVVPSVVMLPVFAAICEDMDIPAILGEWVTRQFSKEGVTVDPTLVTGLFTKAYDLKLISNAAPCFKIPPDLFHELHVGDVQLDK